ncbi:MAG: hypothetical protein RL095_3021 [Verrucomicrobiota bacterium]|jgi:NAD(P)-dependent dehydrogenase (short-subunit alcohol dehydrogenase family)
MDLKLKDKVVIVTGGARGIGAGISELFAQEGAVVVVASRSSPEALDFMQQLGKRTRTLFIDVELGPTAAAKKVVDETLKAFGRIDVLVNNAGVNDGASLESGPEAFRESLQRNILHVYDLLHFALPALKASKGNIVNISSKVAETGQGGTSGYAASKGAMNALTREWALDLAKHSIRVNTVSPAEVMTPLYEKWLKTLDNPQAMVAKIEKMIPFERRMTTLHELGAMVVFLASEVSSHTTGQIIYPDGGYTHLDRKCTVD